MDLEDYFYYYSDEDLDHLCMAASNKSTRPTLHIILLPGWGEATYKVAEMTTSIEVPCRDQP